MAKLYRLEDDNVTPVTESPFSDEVIDMETFVKKNISIIGEYWILAEQAIPGGSGERSDLLAIDKDGRITIIELKNVDVNEEILPQIIRYWDSWRKRPDAIKNYWITLKNKPTNIEPNFEDYDPKIIVIAPSVSDEVVELASKGLQMDIEFVELTRYQENGRMYVVTNYKEPKNKKMKISTAREEYGWKYYLEKKGWTNKIINQLKLIEKILLEFSKNQGWNLSIKFNKNYIAFKHGLRNPFWIEPGSGKIYIGVQIRDEKETLDQKYWYWDKNYNYWYYEFVDLENPSEEIKKIEEILKKAYSNT